MQKNNPFKTQNAAMIAFGLALTTLNAAEQTEHSEVRYQDPMVSSTEDLKEITLKKDDVIEQFIKGINPSDKESVIAALGNINPDRYIDFINTVGQFSREMDPSDKAKVILALGNVNPDRYTGAFISTVNELSKRMYSYQKASVIKALGKVNPDYYRDFRMIADGLSQGMDRCYKVGIIEALGKVSPDRYTDFINTAGQLSEGMYTHQRCLVILALGNINPDRYTQAFINTVHRLSEGMNPSNKATVIESLGKVNPDNYKDLITAVGQLSEGMNEYCKVAIIEALRKVNSDRYTDFIHTVGQFSVGMDPSDKARVIEALGNINPDRYTRAFISTVDQLSEGMNLANKARFIEALGNINPDHYTRTFISTFDRLSEGMKISNKLRVIETFRNVSPDHYDLYIKTVNQLSEGRDNSRKLCVIMALEKLNPELYLFLQTFIRRNSRYFDYVPVYTFANKITSHMTQENLQNLLQDLHGQYYHQAPANTPAGLAFEIHRFANQEVVGETGEKKKFNQAVLNHVKKSIKETVLNYQAILQILSQELETLKKDPNKSGTINGHVYKWVIENNRDEDNIDAIASVVTYLEQQDDTHAMLQTWLYVFMDESNNAYNNAKKESCIIGIKERVITSLRSAVLLEGGPLTHLFRQGEEPFMIETKSKQLKVYLFWAKKLLKQGVKSTSNKEERIAAYRNALNEYFDTLNGAEDVIETMVDEFGDENAILWSKIKSELENIEPKKPEAARSTPLNEDERREPEAARSTPAGNVTVPSLDLETGRAFDAFKTEYLNDKMNSRKPHAFMRAATEYANHHPELNRDLFLEISKDLSHNLR